MERHEFEAHIDATWPGLPEDLRSHMIELQDEVYEHHIASLRSPENTPHWNAQIAEASRKFFTRVIRSKAKPVIVAAGGER